MLTLRKTVLAVAVAGTFALGVAGQAQAAPVASAISVLSFENFVINWNTIDGGRQADSGDFTSLSVTGSLQTSANMTGMTGISENPSTSVGTDLTAVSSLGTVDPVINSSTGAITGDQIFNAPSLPLAGNFSHSVSNTTGSPISNFFEAAASEDLHNASYASLDSLEGSAGTSTSSTLASTQSFVANVGGDSLTFSFDLGQYIGAFLDAGAARSALASWGVSFSLIDQTSGNLAAFFSTGDSISNNSPGTGVTELGALNSTLTGGFVDLTPTSFDSAEIISGNTYLLSANITTRSQVVREVPEPGVLGLLGIGLLCLGASRRMLRKTAA